MRRNGGNSPIGSFIFGLIFLGVGLFSVFIFSRIGELSCTRVEPSSYTCVRNMKLFGLVPLGEEAPRYAFDVKPRWPLAELGQALA